MTEVSQLPEFAHSLRIRQFVLDRLADPHWSGLLVADQAWIDLVRWLAETHHIDGQLESWYWLERHCVACKWTWMQWVRDAPPDEVGPERGCPTMRKLAGLFKEHEDYDEEWGKP